MQIVHKTIIGIAVISLSVFAFRKNLDAKEYKALYFKNQFVLDYLKENNCLKPNSLKEAFDDYDNMLTVNAEDIPDITY